MAAGSNTTQSTDHSYPEARVHGYDETPGISAMIPTGIGRVGARISFGDHTTKEIVTDAVTDILFGSFGSQLLNCPSPCEAYQGRINRRSAESVIADLDFLFVNPLNDETPNLIAPRTRSILIDRASRFDTELPDFSETLTRKIQHTWIESRNAKMFNLIAPLRDDLIAKRITKESEIFNYLLPITLLAIGIILYLSANYCIAPRPQGSSIQGSRNLICNNLDISSLMSLGLMIGGTYLAVNTLCATLAEQVNPQKIFNQRYEAFMTDYLPEKLRAPEHHMMDPTLRNEEKLENMRDLIASILGERTDARALLDIQPSEGAITFKTTNKAALIDLISTDLLNSFKFINFAESSSTNATKINLIFDVLTKLASVKGKDTSVLDKWFKDLEKDTTGLADAVLQELSPENASSSSSSSLFSWGTATNLLNQWRGGSSLETTSLDCLTLSEYLPKK